MAGCMQSLQMVVNRGILNRGAERLKQASRGRYGGTGFDYIHRDSPGCHRQPAEVRSGTRDWMHHSPFQ